LEADTVDLSLLPVSELPDTIWRAASLFRTAEEVGEHLPRPRGDQVLPFVLLKGEVWAFHDLSDTRGPFKQAVDPGTAERLGAARLLKTDDKNIYVWLLNGALRQALLRRGVRLDRGHSRYYFLPDHETITRRVKARTKTGLAQSAKKQRPRTTSRCQPGIMSGATSSRSPWHRALGITLSKAASSARSAQFRCGRRGCRLAVRRAGGAGAAVLLAPAILSPSTAQITVKGACAHRVAGAMDASARP
jgi:hypothetical protein